MVLREPVSERRVLVTGFDPFGGDTVNPSWLAAQALHGHVIGGHRVVAARLPTVFGASVQALTEAMRLHTPTLVVCVGQAGGRAAMGLERVAINVDDARMPDNAGARPVDAPVVAGAPVAYFTTLPVKVMMLAMQEQGIAAEVSQTAGTFVCNHVFYGLMHLLATQPAWAGARGGFIHVPWLPSQGTPSMPLADVVRGLRLGIECALATRADRRVAAGAEH